MLCARVVVEDREFVEVLGWLDGLDELGFEVHGLVRRNTGVKHPPSCEALLGP